MADLDVLRLINDLRLVIEERYDAIVYALSADLRVAHARVAELEAERDSLKRQLLLVSKAYVKLETEVLQ